MESYSRAPAFEMNGQEKNGPSENMSFQLIPELQLRESDDRIAADSLFRDAVLATANAQSPKLVFECGTWRLLCHAAWSDC